MAFKESDIAAKKFKEPTDGNTGIYIYRNEFMGAAIKMYVFVDNKFIGQTAVNTYHYVELAPGIIHLKAVRKTILSLMLK
jgi:hypothetical protein